MPVVGTSDSQKEAPPRDEPPEVDFMISLFEAFEVVSWSQTLLSRLETARDELATKQGLSDEKSWLLVAIERLTSARAELGDLPLRAMQLPELKDAREEHALKLQSAAVDAIERLQAGITFVAGSRAPLLEALFGKTKLAHARRADREDFERFCLDFERKLSSGYCKRMLGETTFAPVIPVVEALRAAISTWRSSFSPTPLAPTETEALKDEIVRHAHRLELPIRQARLLAEAALAPVKNAFENSGIGQKPKRRKPEFTLEAEPVEIPADAVATEIEDGAPSEALVPAQEGEKDRLDSPENRKNSKKGTYKATA
jgi:hypothetical protein